jgi:heme-degrading monooxygenase HmoA
MTGKRHHPQPTIARIWRGRTRRERADAYEAYNYEVGIKPLIEKALGVQTLREDRADGTEFMMISYWESIEAMSRFTGGDPTRIHHLDRDAEFLIELPSECRSCGSTARTATPVAIRRDAAGGALPATRGWLHRPSRPSPCSSREKA